MELWFTENQTGNVGITCKTTRTLHTEKTQFQEMAVIDTVQFGRMLVLDGTVQTTVKDEFVYHEMITHVAMNTHPNPQNVLVVGGGDGGTVREVLKHPSVKSVHLCEIDGRVVEVCKQYLPETSHKLDDPRVTVMIADGVKHVRESKNKYDVILVDSPDPVGPAEGLFAYGFYQGIYDALTEEGIFVAQTESPFYHGDLIARVYADVSRVFPISRLYLAAIPTYPSGLWSFTLGSKKHDPLAVDKSRIRAEGCRYYCPELHTACFGLPAFVRELVTVKGK